MWTCESPRNEPRAACPGVKVRRARAPASPAWHQGREQPGAWHHELVHVKCLALWMLLNPVWARYWIKITLHGSPSKAYSCIMEFEGRYNVVMSPVCEAPVTQKSSSYLLTTVFFQHTCQAGTKDFFQPPVGGNMQKCNRLNPGPPVNPTGIKSPSAGHLLFQPSIFQPTGHFCLPTIIIKQYYRLRAVFIGTRCMPSTVLSTSKAANAFKFRAVGSGCHC